MEDNFFQNMTMFAAAIDISLVILVSIFFRKCLFSFAFCAAIAIFVVVLIPKIIWDEPTYWKDIFKDPSYHRNIWAVPLIFFNFTLWYIAQFFIKALPLFDRD